MSAITYSYTPDAASSPLILSAAEDGLTLTEHGKPVRITWSDVMRVQLGFDPTQLDRNRFRCQLSTRSGRTIAIQSTSYSGSGFVQQSDEYRRFIEAIHADVRTHGKNVVFSGGAVGSSSTIKVVGVVVALVALSVTMMLVGASYPRWTLIGQLIVLGVGVSLTWKWLAKNRSTIYDPRAIPAALLPKAGAEKHRAP